MWATITDEYELDDTALMVLGVSLEAFDRMREAQKAISEHGIMVEDRFGTLKPNPACQVEKASRLAFLSGIRQMNLDLEPLNDGPGRPPGR